MHDVPRGHELCNVTLLLAIAFLHGFQINLRAGTGCGYPAEATEWSKVVGELNVRDIDLVPNLEVRSGSIVDW